MRGDRPRRRGKFLGRAPQRSSTVLAQAPFDFATGALELGVTTIKRRIVANPNGVGRPPSAWLLHHRKVERRTSSRRTPVKRRRFSRTHPAHDLEVSGIEGTYEAPCHYLVIVQHGCQKLRRKCWSSPVRDLASTKWAPKYSDVAGPETAERGRSQVDSGGLWSSADKRHLRGQALAGHFYALYPRQTANGRWTA